MLGLVISIHRCDDAVGNTKVLSVSLEDNGSFDFLISQ